jgi:hypothetical protein
MANWKQVLYTVIPLVLMFCLTVVFSGPAGGCPETQTYIKQNVHVSPVCCLQGDSIPVTITSNQGSIFDLAGGSITTVSFGPGITVKSFQKNGNHSIIVNISVSDTAAIGSRDIFVTGRDNGRNQYAGPITNGFCVQPGAPARPTVGQGIYGINNQPPVMLPSIVVRSATLSASRVTPGTPVTVTADIANTSAANGTGKLTLYVNGQEDSSQGITVSSGSSTPATFTVSRNEPGVYSVYLGGVAAGSFTVDQFADPNIVLYISLTLLGLAFVAGLLFVLKRMKQAH